VSSTGVSPEAVGSVPVYRGLVLLGHEFQNFPSDVNKNFKVRSTADHNIVKWLLQGRKVLPVASQKAKGPSQVPLFAI